MSHSTPDDDLGPTKPVGTRSHDVAKFLSILHPEAGVFEVRSIDCPERPNGNYRSTAAGYFFDPHVAAKAIEELDKLRPLGSYTTMNPVLPALIARANSKIVHHKTKVPTTSDSDIVSRRWLMLDLDPIRPSGVSSTDAEMEAALELADKIEEALAAEGWPKPLKGMSGSGAYLLYRVDVPNNEEMKDLFQRVLKGCDVRFSTQIVHVDTSTFNASRIIKALGTTPRKGDDVRGVPNVEDRPHRQSWFLEPEGELQTASVEQLEAVAAPKEETKSKPASSGHHSGQNGFRRLDAETVKREAQGKWPDILVHVGGLDPVVLTKKGNACPRCGGGTRFDILDIEVGAIICRQCFNKGCGDGIAAVMWLRGWSFGAALLAIAKYLGTDAADPNTRRNSYRVDSAHESGQSPHFDDSDLERFEKNQPQGSVGPDVEPSRAQASVPKSAPWRELEPLEERTLPEFPTRYLPGAFRESVEAAAHATQVPSDMAALLAMATGAAAIAKRVTVQGPGWIEPTNIFVCGIMGPANRKSQIFNTMTAPYQAIEREEIRNALPELAKEKSKRRVAQNRLKILELGKTKLTSEEEADRERLAQELENWPEPVPPKLIGDDITSEDLVRELAANDGRFACMAPEGNAFDLMLGRYAEGKPDFGVYLNGHAGDDIRVGRVTRSSLFVSKPALTVAMTVQPDVIESLQANRSTRGRGLLARFWWAMPASLIGKRLIRPAAIPFQIATAYENIIRFMYAMSPRKLGMGRKADKILLAWQSEVESKVGEGGLMEAISDWGGKLVGLTLRIAGILHCASGNEDLEILPETMEAAIAMARWGIPHAQAVLVGGEWIDEPNIAAAKRFLRWITKKEVREFTRHELHLAVRSNPSFAKADLLTPGLNVLVERGYIRRRLSDSKPGRPPEIFDVNPALYGARNTQKSPNPPSSDALEGDSCVPCANSGELERESDVPWEYDPDEPFGEYR